MEASANTEKGRVKDYNWRSFIKSNIWNMWYNYTSWVMAYE